MASQRLKFPSRIKIFAGLTLFTKEMKNIIFIILLLVLIGPSLVNADDQNVPNQIEVLENKLLAIKNESADISNEELDKASQWTEDAKKSLIEESRDSTESLILKKASYQIEFLNALVEESRSKKKADEMEEQLQQIRSQTEEINNTNAQVTQEINQLEQK